MNEASLNSNYDPSNLDAPSLSVIELRGVSQKFGSRLVLDNVSYSVTPGSVFALLGENGAGKTTTIRTILGELQPTSGSVGVFQIDPFLRYKETRRKIGFVPENPTLYEYMTVAEQGKFVAAFYSKDFMKRYAELCQEFQLRPNDKIAALSKGMKAKVSLALALAHDPELLVLDEPTSGLDALVRRQILENIATFAAEGKTVFLSSHQITEIERVADKVAFMKNGKAILVEPLDELKASTQLLNVSLAGYNDAEPLKQLFESIFTGGLIEFGRFGSVCTLVGRGLVPNYAERLKPALGERLIDAQTTPPTLEDIFLAYMRN